MKNKPEYIVMHCSDSKRGNAKMIDSWHREQGFAKIGYHFVIGNGNGSKPGEVEEGRKIEEVGAHTVGYNQKSIGVCLIGEPFHHNQMLKAVSLVRKLCREHKIPYENVIGHCETPNGKSHNPPKTCPIFDMELFREALYDPPRTL